MIMVTFTKLFVISIRGQQSFCIIQQISDFLTEGCFPSSIEFKSDGESEKNAISEAEAKPEASKSTPANTIAIIAETEGVCTDYTVKNICQLA